MSFEHIGLGRLLIAMCADKAKRKAILRQDIRRELHKLIGDDNSSGGDFYGPIWADFKAYAGGGLNLIDATQARIELNGRRRRLYKLLSKSFISWLDMKSSSWKTPITVVGMRITALQEFSGLGDVKVQNALKIVCGDESIKIIYPYFCEHSVLTVEIARLGLWLMQNAIEERSPNEIIILDALRSQSYSSWEMAFSGSEKAVFTSKYAGLLVERKELYSECGIGSEDRERRRKPEEDRPAP